MEDVVRIGLPLGECVGLQHRQKLAAFPTQHRRGGALMLDANFQHLDLDRWVYCVAVWSIINSPFAVILKPERSRLDDEKSIIIK